MTGFATLLTDFMLQNKEELIMKILFTVRFYPMYGGGETVTLRLADKFADMGHEVHIFYLWDNGKQEVNRNIHTFKVNNMHSAIGGEKIPQKDVNKIYNELAQYIKLHSIEFIINQWLEPRKVYQAAGGTAKVLHCRHAAVYINSKKRRLAEKILGRHWFDKILKHIYSPYVHYSDRFVLLCKEYADEMKHIFRHKYDNKIISILNPCRYDISLPKLVQQEKENAICYVGRLYPEKQVDILLNAWKQLEDIVIKDGWKFYVVGKGESLEYLQTVSGKLNCKNVFFEGYQNPENYYRSSKIFVSASATEGYPMTIVEAMAFGCVPVVANTYTALDGILFDHENGYKINPLKPDDFIKTLRLLMTNQTLLDNIKTNTYEFCRQNYEINKIAKEWIGLFEKLTL